MSRVFFTLMCVLPVFSLRGLKNNYLSVMRDLETTTIEDPQGPGAGESSFEAACAECASHQEHIVTTARDDCFCFATDTNGTFESDATKSATLRSTETSTDAEGNVTHTSVVSKKNEGLERLPEHWLWHCRQVTDTEGTWKSCPAPAGGA